MPGTIAGHAMQLLHMQNIIQAFFNNNKKKTPLDKQLWRGRIHSGVELAREHGVFHKSFIASTLKSAHQANITGKHGCIYTAGFNAQFPFFVQPV